ncbi:MBL fold metallo-hydrolase [Paenibacillus radicis (ex Xue et al. 2023)]|uniref:MBL fold metallo-hydrolase n=1 Tax=Paenibacillus radicis (ex Xue et al. 2023) TaxID=2972489 RepID=A0ABT1Y8Y2_9BACL|nr:MBL fold metallo-hydrolase [Paenibacillus radicis (ex Xue et al. 2023)]MCR8629647.1 MBL fold metallo-hydrolase [Paenibacillus radicis (ex Xue et al. 2023)]
MSLFTLHNESIYQIKAPLPFPLRWVNSYLIRGKDGYTLIDPGLHTEAAEQFWEQAMHELGIGFRDIEQIVLTHHHPDHYGLAGYFQERSDAPVRMSAIGYEQVGLLWGEGQPMTASLLRLFTRHGMPEEMLLSMQDHMDSFVSLVSPQPKVSIMTIGDSIMLGDHEYATLHTPGHAAGHVCFYRAETKEMLCGDHVIPQISPNVSYLPGSIDENPLGSFLQSLEAIGRYDVAWAYPGHREPFEKFSLRTQELIQHHESRLELMREMLLERPLTAYEVCRNTFGNKLTLHQLRFALSETLAHLIYMRESGKIKQVEQEACLYFQA